MAKASTTPKKKASEATKKAPVKKKSITAPALHIDTVNEHVLALLQKLGLEEKLCSDIEWCLGSYRHDQNASGLLETAQRALVVLKEVKSKKAKAVPAKIITDLQKIIK